MSQSVVNLNDKKNLDSFLTLKLVERANGNVVKIDYSDLLKYDEILTPSKEYRLVKCTRSNNTIKIKQEFQPVKAILEVDSDPERNVETLKQEVDNKHILPCPKVSKANTLTVKIIRKLGKNGTAKQAYQLCSIKDLAGNLVLKEDEHDILAELPEYKCKIFYDKRHDRYYCLKCEKELSEDDAAIGFRCQGNANNQMIS